MLNYNEKEFVNVGYGNEITIKDLALLIKKIIGFEGHLEFDTSKPNGTPRKLMDSSRLFATGWTPKTDLEEGIALAYQDFLNRKL
jgi:GDP-L-fucose synthase